MEWFSNRESIDENAERKHLLHLSEKELMIELVIKLKEINLKCDEIKNVVLWLD